MIEEFNLSAYNTFGIESIASHYVPILSEIDLEYLPENRPCFILGGGSNVLLPDRMDAVVLHNKIDFLRVNRLSNDDIIAEVGGGMNWHRFVTICVKMSWGGIENLALIPGSVGAAPIQNIGAYGVEQKQVFVELRAYDLKLKRFVIFSKEECRFGYRDSIFKHESKGRYFITSVKYRLKANRHEVNLSYATLREALEKQPEDVSIKEVYQSVIAIRESKLPDPKELGNSGSFFKNPIVSKEKFLQLSDKFSDLKYFSVDGETYKIPAGYLIESCGWKGSRVGKTGCYEKQALVVVNYGGATAKEVMNFVEDVKRSVEQKFGILLEEEVNIIA